MAEELNRVSGSVMVVGGGVAGIQASLDLADSGFHVYLLEKSTAVGGIMPQLDKTFPTNDCSMCIVSPKLVEVNRHPDIELITGAELLDLEGEKGNFRARFLRKPRYIDLDKCTGCGECATVCPVSIANEFEQGLSSRKAVFKKYPQAAPSAYSITKSDRPPCVMACPAGINVQGYVQMVRQGKYEEALKIIMDKLPMPGVLGRICPHGCEDACRRKELDEPVAIRNLKRLAADRFDPGKVDIPCLPARNEKVAIIGSGPAGLSAAYHLARMGILSTIFEALPAPGGMLKAGIPDFRLPPDILSREIELITNLGVDIRTNMPLGPDMTIDHLFDDGFSAVYLAMGAHKGLDLSIPGERAQGVRQGVEFLRELNLKGKTSVGKRVAVIGGGNVAIDVARSALRLGALEVNIIYRRSRSEMPAWEEEIEAAEAEGTVISYLSAPQEILVRDGRVEGLRCIRMKLGEPDSSGRRRPVPIPGSEYDIPCDQVIPAIGQRPDLTAFEDSADIRISKWGTVEVDPLTYETARKGVFAGGDLQTGPWVAIGAVAAGREAAISISRYLDGEDMKEGREPIEKEDPVFRPIPENEPLRARARMPGIDSRERGSGFMEVETGYGEEEGRREADRCLNCGDCCECLQCVETCMAEAVIHNEMPEERIVDVGSVILCPGSVTFDPKPLDDFYLHETHPNVVTSLEFERILSASGPFMGHLVRPSDKKEPEKIAWIQCVGSRDRNRGGNGYCSSMCCMYAIKEAVIAKEHSKSPLDTAIFFMDMRTFGKDYEKYYTRAREEHGVRFIRSRIHSIDSLPDSDELVIRYIDEKGDLKKEQFDMVVLSVGINPAGDARELAKRLGIELNTSGFAATDPFAPVNTSRDGVYACGIFQGPKDIPGSITDGTAAAAAAAEVSYRARGTEIKNIDLPDEKDLTGVPPRIGVFVCNCGINIGGVVDVPAVSEYAAALPNVVYAGHNLFTCSQDTQEIIKATIEEHRLNRIVVASCSPRTHESLFQETLRACGLNKYLFEMANIRDQDSWVHGSKPVFATEKAKDLVRMAVARAGLIKPLLEKKITVNKRGLVIGGGVAGMNAALGLANQGFEVIIIEKEPRLGGFAGYLTSTIEGRDIQSYLAGLITEVTAHPNIQVLTEALVVDFSGVKGNFTTEVIVGPGMYSRRLTHGATVLATGATAYIPEEYLYGRDSRIMTQLEFGRRLETIGDRDLNRVIMIQCVGSRNDENPNCSRICCQHALKNAISIKDISPDTEVIILYRDIRAYGLLEEYYTKARDMGVIFSRFERDDPPEVEISQENRLSVTFRDHILDSRIRMTPDMVVLSTGMVPNDTDELAGLLKVPRNSEKYFMEAHVKLRPVDMPSEGIFVCGTAHSPGLISEKIGQAKAAASRAGTFLSQDEITLSAVTATVDEDLCAACLVCVKSCPYGVPRINRDGVSEIDAALCHGCGVCVAECPARAITLNWYEDVHIMSQLDALLAGGAQI